MLDTIKQALVQRKQTTRDQGSDNQLFSPVTNAMIAAHGTGNPLLAADLATAAIKLAHQYEQETGSEIHKGALAFNAALMYLELNDFTAAMRYFEIAETETRATETSTAPSNAPSTFDLFRFPLFEKSFWDRVDQQAKLFPVEGYKALWGSEFDKVTAQHDWASLSDKTKLLYIMSVARRMRYRELAKETSWSQADSLYLAHWNLSADLARAVETELKGKKHPPGCAANTLGKLLEQCFKHTKNPPNLSKLQIALHGKYGVKDSSTFNTTFKTIRHNIEHGATAEDRISHAVYLLRAARNQVAHSVDDSLLLFTDPAASTFTVDVLLSLCRVGAWSA